MLKRKFAINPTHPNQGEVIIFTRTQKLSQTEEGLLNKKNKDMHIFNLSKFRRAILQSKSGLHNNN